MSNYPPGVTGSEWQITGGNDELWPGEPTISFTCEACKVENVAAPVDVDGHVTCIECDHTVHVGVYLGPEWEEDLATIAHEDRIDWEAKQ